MMRTQSEQIRNRYEYAKETYLDCAEDLQEVLRKHNVSTNDLYEGVLEVAKNGCVSILETYAQYRCYYHEYQVMIYLMSYENNKG